ncbi:hypothetical protein ACFC1B_15480 [Streptomyces xiamenensis]|uniref:hypothetical protein n=1 Tax=Streptomyces xiamenensis TaxID=408015 RepID=UPI0011D24347|nr:hypothetical protein [Streptomyces xiamenensis]
MTSSSREKLSPDAREPATTVLAALEGAEVTARITRSEGPPHGSRTPTRPAATLVRDPSRTQSEISRTTVTVRTVAETT